MSDEENLSETEHDFGENSTAATAGVELAVPVAAGAGDRPPTREEFEQLAAEVRRLAGQIAHGRS